MFLKRAFLVSARSYSTQTLKNGVKIVANKNKSSAGSVSFYIESGSRHEESSSNGSSELIRRLAVNGNEKYIQEELGARGATIGSQTSHEQTVYYSRCNAKDIPKVLEVLSKITSKLNFSEDAVNQQKHSLIQSLQQEQSEVSNYEKYMDEHLHSIAFQQCPLSLPVNGSIDSVTGISSSSLAQFYKDYYCTGRMVVSVSGDFDEQSLVSQVQDLFNFGSGNNSMLKIAKPAIYTGSAVKIQDDFLPDSHVAVALRGPAAGTRDSIGIQLLLATLGHYDHLASGGKAFESRFVSSLETEKGTYVARPFFRAYRDVSLFGVYGHMEYDMLWNFVHHVLTGFTRPLHGLTDAELNRAKRLLVNALSEKRSDGLKKNHYLSQNALYNSPTLEETIDSIGHKELADIADRYAYDTDPALAAFGNMQYFPDYHFVRNWTYPKSL